MYIMYMNSLKKHKNEWCRFYITPSIQVVYYGNIKGAYFCWFNLKLFIVSFKKFKRGKIYE